VNKKAVIAILVVAIAAAGFFFIRKKRSAVEPAIKTKSVVATKGYKTVAVIASYFTDLETVDAANWAGFQNDDKFLSGKFSNKLDDQMEYGITFTKNGMEIPQHEKIREIKLSFQVYSDQPLKKASFVCAVTGSKDKFYEYFQEDITADSKKWLNVEISMPVNATLWGNDAVIKIYPWNPGKERFFLDDIRIDFLSEVERQQGYSIGPQQNFTYDFEPVEGSPVPGIMSTDVAHSGKYAMKISGADSYSDNITKRFSEIATDTVKFISASVWLYPKQENPVVTLVVSIEKPDGSSIAWNGKATDLIPLKKNEWQKINFRADLRETKTTPDDVIKVYIWNKKGGTVYADDLEIVYGDIPNPAGQMPGIRMSMIGDQISNTGKNKPPFTTSYFSEGNFFNPPEEKKIGEMNPNDLLLAGSFSGRTSANEDLFIAGEKNWLMYTWCKGKNKFIQSSSAPAPFSVNGKVTVTGFFDNLNSEEILFIDTTGKSDVPRLRFISQDKDVCNANSKSVYQELTKIPPVNNASFIVSGQFLDDKNDELLLCSSEGSWKIFGMMKGGFILKSEGTIAQGKILSIHAIETGNAHEKLLVFSERDNKLDYCLVDFSNDAKASIKEFKDKSFLDYYHRQSVFFSGAFEKAGATSLLYFNPEWRFDLKKISLTDNGFVIDSQIDFIQKNPEVNPRYYEYTKFLQGKFFEDRLDYLLVLMQNCKDPDFDGKHCSEFEDIENMPGGFGFYHYQGLE